MTNSIRRWLLASLAVAAVGATGCIITSAQILTYFELSPDPPHSFQINAADPWDSLQVDLTVDVGEDYTDNKDKLKGVTDLAVLGEFTNTGGAGGAVTVWITATETHYGDVGTITSSAQKLWGPASIGPTGDKVVIDWDDSAALFDPVGKKLLINEVVGDGIFTIYTTGTPSGTHDILVENGKVVLVLDAGQ
jgi:hypothetical protein